MLIKTKSGRRVQVPTPQEDAAISAGIAADPNTYELSTAEFSQLKRMGRPRSTEPLKKATTIRFDVDVLEALRAGGDGWQTRVNDALRAWLMLAGKLS